MLSLPDPMLSLWLYRVFVTAFRVYILGGPNSEMTFAAEHRRIPAAEADHSICRCFMRHVTVRLLSKYKSAMAIRHSPMLRAHPAQSSRQQVSQSGGARTWAVQVTAYRKDGCIQRATANYGGCYDDVHAIASSDLSSWVVFWHTVAWPMQCNSV